MAGGHDCSTGLPGGLEVGAFEQAAELQDVFCSALSPEHAGLFEAAAYDCFAAGFNDAAADEVALAAKVSVAGALVVGSKVGDFSLCGFFPLVSECGVCCEYAGGLF